MNNTENGHMSLWKILYLFGNQLIHRTLIWRKIVNILMIQRDVCVSIVLWVHYFPTVFTWIFKRIWKMFWLHMVSNINSCRWSVVKTDATLVALFWMLRDKFKKLLCELNDFPKTKLDVEHQFKKAGWLIEDFIRLFSIL